VPGPRRGTSTTASVGPSVPDSSPFIALALGTDATGFSVDLVTLEKLLSTGWVGTVVGTDVVTGGVVRVVVRVVGIVTASVVVVARTCAVGTVVDVLDAVAEVRVKTSTRSSTGLDHISRWALFRENCRCAMFFEG
jgi:hypothetical protein